MTRDGGTVTVTLTLENRGVARPFLNPPARVGLFAADGTELTAAAADWHLDTLQPGDAAPRTATFTSPADVPAGATAGVFIPDVLPGAKPLRLANGETDEDGVLRLGPLP